MARFNTPFQTNKIQAMVIYNEAKWRLFQINLRFNRIIITIIIIINQKTPCI
jgi:hypothetical protein